METIKIGLIGAGGNTRTRHIPGFLNIENIELTAVANRSLESSKKIADEFGVQKAVANWKSIIEDPIIDAVCIGTWPYICLLYTSPSPRDLSTSRMPSSA